MAKKAKLLWVDLEMTGLEPEKDKILEVACVWTGWDLEIMGSYEAVVAVSPEIVKSRMVGAFWDDHADLREKLMSQNIDGKPATEVEKEILAIIEEKFGTDVYLAGNSIHQDRKFIDREWPELSKRLHYRMLDVSAWKIYFEGTRHKRFVKPEEHRAMSDILGSIEEMKYYKKFIKE